MVEYVRSEDLEGRGTMRIATVVGVAVSVAVIASVGAPAVARPVSTTPSAVAAAGTSTTVGVVSGNTGVGVCDPQATVLQTASTVGTYVVPSAGVATSVSYNANSIQGQIRAAFFVPGAQANHWTVVGKSELLSVSPNTLNSFPVRIPVQSGWRLGLYVSTNDMNCNGPTGMTADKQDAGFFNPGTQSDFAPSQQDIQGYRANVAVTVESDVDGDGFGDVSQDACPESATTQAPCPAPDTTITKVKKRAAKRIVKIKFTSDPGTSFTCKVDRKRAKPCLSPFKKRYSYGRHKVVITATSAAGIIDPSPTKVKFRIKRPR